MPVIVDSATTDAITAPRDAKKGIKIKFKTKFTTAPVTIPLLLLALCPLGVKYRDPKQLLIPIIIISGDMKHKIAIVSS